MIRYIHLILSLMAGILVGIVSIKMNDDVTTFFVKLIISMVIFYIVGIVVKKVLTNIVKVADDKEKEAEIKEMEIAELQRNEAKSTQEEMTTVE